MTREEIWVPIKEYEGLYEISSLGNVKSIPRKVLMHTKKGGSYISKEKLLIQSIVRNYLAVCLYKHGVSKMYKVHRLVTTAFIPNPDNKPQVNHIDGIKTHNCVSNLEWVTRNENMQHAHDNNLVTVHRGKNHKGVKEVHCYDINGNYVQSYFSVKEASDILGIDRMNIGAAARSKKKAKNRKYNWSYEKKVNLFKN